MGNVVVPSARPSHLLAHIIVHCGHPTTLVVCASQDEFAASFLADTDDDGDVEQLLRASSSLLQVAVSRHIRVAFAPTVAHLRAFLAAFDPAASPVRPPPRIESSRQRPSDEQTDDAGPTRPALFVYGFTQLHRDTSEWSAQGLANSAAVLVETARRVDFHAVVVDPPPRIDGHGYDRVPVLSTVPRRQLQQAGYALRTEPLDAVLGRWFDTASALSASPNTSST